MTGSDHAPAGPDVSLAVPSTRLAPGPVTESPPTNAAWDAVRQLAGPADGLEDIEARIDQLVARTQGLELSRH